jgi:hypothetical protein
MPGTEAGTEPHVWGMGRMDDITYFGLDVHKATVCVAVAESGRCSEVRQVGVFENRPEILCMMAARLGKEGRRLSFCYEVEPGGHDRLVLAKTAGRHTEPDAHREAPFGRSHHLPRVTRHHRGPIAALLGSSTRCRPHLHRLHKPVLLAPICRVADFSMCMPEKPAPITTASKR